jgi:DNA-directed RNA polymerase specialized sigma24 family protein
LAQVWEEEWKQDLFQRALVKVRTSLVNEKQYQIFDLYALQGWPARKVARSLGVALPKVYFVKHHVSRLLSKEIQRTQKMG